MPPKESNHFADFEFSPTNNRQYVDRAAGEVHQVLVEFVKQQMQAMYGDRWRARALEILNKDRKDPRDHVAEDFERDPSKVLHLIQKDFRSFSAVLKGHGKTLIQKMIGFRNQVAHESEMDDVDTFHAFDTFCKLLTLLNHHSPEITAKRNALQRRLAQHAPIGDGLAGGQPPREDEAHRVARAPWQTVNPDEQASNDRLIDERDLNRNRSSVGILIGGIVCLAALGLGLRSFLSVPRSADAPVAESRLPQSTTERSGPRRPERATAPATQKRDSAKLRQVSDVASGDGPQIRAWDSQKGSDPVGPVSSKADVGSNQIAERSNTAADQPPASPVAPPAASAPPNLVINGDFSRPWDVGWRKELSDPTQGSFIVEEQSGMLHMALKGKNTGQVWQTVQVPAERGLEGLSFEAGVKLIPMRAGMLGLAPPVETALILQFNGPNSRELGQIWFTQFATTGFEDSGLAGVPGTLRATGQRCQIALRDGFNRITESLDRKAKDCLARPPSSISSIMLGVMMRTSNPESSAEAFLDQVRLFYR